MKRLNVLTEGQTEEKFVWDLLAPHLANFGVVVGVQCLTTGKTRRYQAGAKRQTKFHKGGLLDFAQASRDLRKWRNNDPSAFLTTMFDLYALPKDFPEYQETLTLEPTDRVKQLEGAFAKQLGLENFIPYLQLHEFEALLFTNVQILNAYLAMDSDNPEKTFQQLQAIVEEIKNPELINASPQTAPSKRLISIFAEQYNKVEHGNVVASEIGLSAIRAACPHFNDWLTKLESL
jgi:hypothetical protein